MLLYLFCEGKTEDNLKQVNCRTSLVHLIYLFQMFNLFDEDGNGTISIDELLNMMAFFIEIGERKTVIIFSLSLIPIIKIILVNIPS